MRHDAAVEPSASSAAPFDWVLLEDPGEVTEQEDRDRMTSACQVLLHLLRPQIDWAYVDAHSDFDSVMPPEVREAETQIAAKGEARKRSNLGRMNVELDPENDDEWQQLCTYAAWSINVDLFQDGRSLATFHDSGSSITARLTPLQAAPMNESLPSGLQMVPLAPLLLERKLQRRAVRSDRRAARAARRRAWWSARLHRQH